MKNRQTAFTIVSKGGARNFSIVNAQGTTAATFAYKNWFSSGGEAKVGTDIIAVKAKTGWGTTYAIFRNNQPVGQIRFNWKGHMLIQFRDAMNTEYAFKLKREGFWKIRWVLQDSSGRIWLVMHSDFKWRKMKYSYQVEVIDTGNLTVEELLIICGYATNLYLMITSSQS